MPRRKQVNPKPLKRQREEAEELLRKVNETSSPTPEEDGEEVKGEEAQAAGKPDQVDTQLPKRQRIGTRSANKDNKSQQQATKNKKATPKADPEVTKSSQNGRKVQKKPQGKGRGKGRGRGQRQPKPSTKLPSPKANNHDENSLDQFELADEDTKSGKEVEKEIVEKPKPKTAVSEKPSSKRTREPMKSSPDGKTEVVESAQTEPDEQTNMTDLEVQARNEALEALLQITDSELNKMDRSPSSAQPPFPPQVSNSPAQQPTGQRSHPAESPAVVAMPTGVLRAVHDGRGDVQYHAAVEQQALKLLYTKQSGVAESHMLYRASKIMGKTDLVETMKQEELAKQEKKQKKAGRHVCPYCGRGCAKPSVLKKHIRSHTGERPYPCVPCGFAFKTKSNLYKHRKSHAHALKAGLVTNPDGSKIEAMDDIIDDGVDTTDSEDDSDETVEGKVSEGSDHAQKLLASNMRIPSSYAMPVHMSVSSAGSNTDDPGLSEGLASKMRVPYPSPQPNQSQPMYFVPGREGSQVQMHPDKFVLIQPQVSQVPSGLPVNMPVHMRPAVQTLAQTVRERLAAKSQENLADKSRQEALRQRRMAISNLSPLPPLKTSNFGNMMSLSMSSLPDVGQQSTPTSMVPRQQAVQTMSSPLTPGSKSVSMSNVASKDSSQQPQRSLDRESLHERIMQLINQNEAIVESQSLENVKPRRMSGSRRSSIESPKPTSMGYLDLMKKSSPEVTQQMNSQSIQGRRGSLGNLSEMQTLGAGIPPMTPVTTISFSLSPSPSMGLVAIATTAPASPLVTATGFIATPPSNGSSRGSSPVVQLPTRAEVLSFQMTHKKGTEKEMSEKWSGPQGKGTEPQLTSPLVPINVNSVQTSAHFTSTAAATSGTATQAGPETGSSMIKELLLSRGRIQTEMMKSSTERDLPKHPTYANPLELQTSVRMIQKEDRVLHSPKKRKLYEEMQAKAQRQAMAALQQSGSQATVEGPPLKIFLEEGRVLSPNVRENSPHYATSATNMAARPSEGSSTPLETNSSQSSSSQEAGQQVHSNYQPAIQKETKDQQGEKTVLLTKSDTFSQLPSEKLPPKKKLLYAGMHSPNPEARLAMGEGSSGLQTAMSQQGTAADVKKTSGNVLQPLQSLYRLANIKDPPAAFMTKPDVSSTVADPNIAVSSLTRAMERDKEVSSSAVRPEQLVQPVSEKPSSFGNDSQVQKGHVSTPVVSTQSLQSVGTAEHKLSSGLSSYSIGQQSHQAVTLDKIVTVPAAGQHYSLSAANSSARTADVGQLSSPLAVTQEKKLLPQSLSHATQKPKEGVMGTAPFIQSTAHRQEGTAHQGKTAGIHGPPGQLTPYTGQLAVQFSQQTAQVAKHHSQQGQGTEPHSQHAAPSNIQIQLKKSPSEEQVLHSRGQQMQTTAQEEVQHDRQSNPPRADPNTSTRHRVPYVTFERGKENIVVINVPAPAPPREMQSMKLEQTGNIIKANIMPGAGGQQRMLVQMAVPLGGQTVPTNQSSLVSPPMQGIGMGQRQQKVAMARAQMQGAAIKPDQFGKTVEVMASLQPVALLTFCTLHRPQPIHLEQGSNQSISMYAKWNIVPSSIDVRGNLSLYNSQVNKRKYRRGITTIANSTQPRGGILTPSSFWSSRHKVKATQQALQVKGQTPQPTKEETVPQAGEGATAEGEVSDSRKKLKEAIRAKNEPLRVKIFDGGYKSNEDYVYVRGRGRGKYVCEDCGIRCKKPSMLKKHIRTHTDVRPYHCKYCNFSFKTKGNLTKHMKSKAHSKKCLETGVPVEDGAVDETGEETASSTGQDAGVEDHQFSDAETTDSAEDEETESENENDDEDDEEEVVEIQDSGISQGGGALSSSSMQTPELFSMYPHSLSVSSIGLSTIYGKSVSLSQNPTPLASPPASLPAPEELSKTIQKTVRDLEGKEDGSKIQESGRLDLLAEALKVRTKPATVPPPLTIGSTQAGMGFWGLTQSLKQPQTSVIPPTSFQLPPPQPPEQRTPEKPNSLTPQVSSPLPPVLTPQKTFAHGPPLPSPLLLSPPPLLDKHGYVTSQIISANQPLPGHKTGKTAMPQKQDVVSVRLLAEKGNPVMSSMPGSVAEEKGLQKEHTIEKKPPSTNPQFKQLPHLVPEADRQADLHHTQVQVKNETTEPKVKVETAEKLSQSQREDATPQHESLISTKTVDAMQLISEREKPLEGEIQQVMHANIQDGDSSQTKVIVTKDGQVEEFHTCHLCKRAFQWGRMLQEHMRAHVEERPFTCKECAVSFRTKGHLSKHERSQTHHLKVEADAQFMEWNEVEVVDSTNDPRPFKCKECKVAFRIPGHLAKHLRSKGHAYAVERQERIHQLDGSSSAQISPGSLKTGLQKNTGDVGVGTAEGAAGRELIQHGDLKSQTSPSCSKTSSETLMNVGLKKEVTARGRIRSISETEAEKLGREKHLFERFTRERTISETEAYAPQMRVAAGMVPLRISTSSMAPAAHYILPQTSGQVLQQLPGIMYAQAQPMSPRLAKTHIPIQPALPTNSTGVRTVMQPSLAIVPQVVATDGKTAIVGTPVSMPSTLPMQPLLIPQEQARNPGAPGQPQILPRMTAPGLLMPVTPQHHQTPSPAVPSTAGAQHRLQMISLAKGSVPFIVTAPTMSPISPGAPSSVNVHGAPPSSVLANISPGSYSPQSSDLAARTCPHCKRSFKSARYVSKHIQTRHSGVKNFKCPYEGCDKEYAIKESYKYHISTHERNSNRQASLEQQENVKRQRTISEQTDSSIETMSGPSVEKSHQSLGETSAQSVPSQQIVSIGQDERKDKKDKIEEPLQCKDTEVKAGESTKEEDQQTIDENTKGTMTKESSPVPVDTKKDCDNLAIVESSKDTDEFTKSSEDTVGFKEETCITAVPIPGTRGQGGKQGVETRRKRKLREQVTVKHTSPKTRKKDSAKVQQQTNTTPKKLSEKRKPRTAVESTRGGTSKTNSSLLSHKLETPINADTQTYKQTTESLDGNERKVEESESKLKDKEEENRL
ncbi:transcription factor HIVEP3-like [Branchiostoma floridae]|uniref:Zinc finger protein 40 n=1 Tax=Branchiostoma floridae TaxID=7739 RepID=A0A9J7KHL3_BRAFL|nr:transcription factor HIVEP3-like [Branchiostoma floridae]